MRDFNKEQTDRDQNDIRQNNQFINRSRQRYRSIRVEVEMESLGEKSGKRSNRAPPRPRTRGLAPPMSRPAQRKIGTCDSFERGQWKQLKSKKRQSALPFTWAHPYRFPAHREGSAKSVEATRFARQKKHWYNGIGAGKGYEKQHTHA